MSKNKKFKNKDIKPQQQHPYRFEFLECRVESDNDDKHPNNCPHVVQFESHIYNIPI